MAIHAAVFLITLSGLIFEIGLTRIYSATIWYHFAFIAVSVALGWGLGGVVRVPVTRACYSDYWESRVSGCAICRDDSCMPVVDRTVPVSALSGWRSTSLRFYCHSCLQEWRYP